MFEMSSQRGKHWRHNLIFLTVWLSSLEQHSFQFFRSDHFPKKMLNPIFIEKQYIIVSETYYNNTYEKIKHSYEQ